MSSEIVPLVLLGLLLIGAPELYGGVFPWAVVVIASVALATLAATLWAARGERPMGIPWVAIAITGAAAWTLIQAMPLPCGLVSRLAPESATELRSVLTLVGSPAPSWCALSRDPGATRLEVLKGVAIASSFLAAWLLSVHGARGRVVWLVACSTLVMSIVAHLHMALGLTEVFGVYRPIYTGGGLMLAPLMNPNNLGGFAALGVPVWLGILRRERQPRGRALAVLAIVLAASTALLSLSRGAIAMLFGCISLMAFVGLARARKPSRDRGRRRWLPRLVLGVSASLGIALGAYLAADRVLIEFAQGDAEKIRLIGETFSFATKHPWLGVGRGAFASTYVGRGDVGLFQYSENFFTQWASDWGFPVAILLLAALAHALWTALRADTSLKRLGAIVGVFGLALQNLFDLGLELAGMAVVAAALLGAAVAPSQRPKTRTAAAWGLSFHRFALAVGATAALAMVFFGPGAERDSTDALASALRAHVAAKNRSTFRALLERAVRLHPVEPVFAVIAASESLLHRDRLAPRWINRGMRLAPGWTAPHVQAFQWLWVIGRRDQALLEMRAVAEIDPNAIGPYVCYVARAGAEPLLRAAPRAHRKQRADFLELASSCVGADQAVSQEIDAVLRHEFPDSPAARERDAMRLAQRGRLDAALAELDAVRRRDPSREATRMLRVQLLLDGHRYAEAARTALDFVKSTPSREAARLWTLRARALAQLGDDPGWNEALSQLRRVVSDDTDLLADAYALQAELHIQRAQTGKALRAYRDAYRIKEDSSYLAAYANISLQLGDRASALWAYMRLCDVRSSERSYCQKRDELLDAARAVNFGDKVRN